ncbi:SDR family oxidoreductase [Sciscionella sediminilitoris]|uniref:SDR family oxidoreductase n=1 Tax=Sciscionella sediminilitoris TaxID=1445613 RepID=UPI0004DF5105|nr:SDR family oxidoreductase [Sciscionella sp. SE31]
MATGEFAGKTALVTGASRGIGRATAFAFAERGANVVLCSRKQEGLDQVAEEIRAAHPEARVLPRAAHAADDQQAREAVEAAVEAYGGLDVLVNNAGTNPYMGPMVDIDAERARKTFEVNQWSIVAWTKAAWHAAMAERSGAPAAVVNIASIGGLATEPGIGFYNATKSAVMHLTRQFAAELAPKARVNAIAPGIVRTKLAEALWKEHEERIAEAMPLKRIGEPEDIANAVLFLAGEQSSWLTGHTLVVDGGALVRPQIA